MKRYLLTFLLIIPFLGACSKDAKNQEMLDLVNGKDHDSRLFGWWQSTDDNTRYLFFDDSSFKMELYYYESGVLAQYSKEMYWYTENEYLYSFKLATELSGIISSKEAYQFSDNDNTLTLMVSGTGDEPAYCRVEHP